MGELLLAAAVLASGAAAAVDKPARAGNAGTVTIMVAASTQDAVEAAAVAFTNESGIAVKVVPGGSNALATQILAGAPADLFLAASHEWAEQVATAGQVLRQQALLTNDLVLVVPAGNPGGVKTPADLVGPAVGKIALAGERVPCGKYAAQALGTAKLYDQLVKERKIVRGRDVRVALQYVARGEAEAGIVYSTDAALFKEVEVVYRFDPRTFDRIIYPLVLLKSAESNDAAARFYNYLISDTAKDVFRKFGFAFP